MNDVHAWHDGGVLHLRLNRPQRRNAVTADMLGALTGALRAAGTDPEVRVVAISGEGPVFCSGADLEARDEPGADPSPATVDAANELVRAITRLPKVVVAAVAGPAVGVGVSIALAADLAILREDAYLLLAFTKVGLMPDGGAAELITAAAGRATALRLGLLAKPLSAHEALSLGLIAAVHDESGFDDAVGRTLAALVNGPAQAFARTKRVVNATALRTIEETFVLERAGQLELLASPDFAEGVAAFEQKRKPRFGAA